MGTVLCSHSEDFLWYSQSMVKEWLNGNLGTKESERVQHKYTKC